MAGRAALRITPAGQIALQRIVTGEYFYDPETHGGRVLKHQPGVTPFINPRTLRRMYKDGLATRNEWDQLQLTPDGQRYAIALGYMKPPRRDEE